MGKLAGSLCILVGCAVLLAGWIQKNHKKQECMTEMIKMLRSWEYALETKRICVADFLERYCFEMPELQEIIKEVRELLLLNEYPDGAVVWHDVLSRHRSAIGLSQEAYQILQRAGDGFFGGNRMEALRCIRQCMSDLQRCMEEERDSYRRKYKVYMPVGMLLGVMLVILLV